VKKWALEILNDSNSPIIDLVNIDAVKMLAAAESDYGKPWFGQLMAGPQLFANLIQLNTWFRKYKISLV
jgi:asparagine synthase (glutamine-hydrolysing)